MTNPELLAVITRKKTGKVIVVVKRGGPPVHISEVIPQVIGAACPVCGSLPVVVGVPVHGRGDHGWVAGCNRGDHQIEVSATTREAAVTRWNTIAHREAPAA